MIEPMVTDPVRHGIGQTGIYVRAKKDGEWDSVDIAELDKDSLLRFLRSRGGDNKWAENTCLIVLGHQPEES